MLFVSNGGVDDDDDDDDNGDYCMKIGVKSMDLASCGSRESFLVLLTYSTVRRILRFHQAKRAMISRSNSTSILYCIISFLLCVRTSYVREQNEPTFPNIKS